jgi:dUTP pyrophosphatase
VTLKFRKVHPDAIIPTRKHQYDAGVDLCALQYVVIPPWSQEVVDTGVELVELPELELASNPPNYLFDWSSVYFGVFSSEWKSVLQIWPKSGLDANKALHTGAGIVDYLYRGRVLILVKNQSDNIIMIHKGDPIAQGVVVPCYVGEVEETMENNETERGATGGIVNEV